MTIIQAVLLGILQGIAEFLPISSSGHLVVFRAVLGIEDIPVLFDVLLHLSTLAAVLIVFRKRVGLILLSLWRYAAGGKTEDDRKNMRLFLVLVLGTACTGVLGLLISRFEFEGYPKLVSAFFIVTAIILYVTRYRTGTDTYETLRPRHGFITGIAQGIGVLPGISRSGITISAALYSGMRRDEAGEFSFLISIPAILGALLLSLKDAGDLSARVSGTAIAAGLTAAFIVGMFSLLLLLRLIKKGRLYYFSFYLVPLGILGLIFL